MKSLIKKIYSNNFLLSLRNTFGIKRNPIYFGNLKNNFYISDNFLWRLDSNYTTKFIFSDLLDLFYKKKNSEISIFFYDKNANFIKKLDLDIEKNFEIVISKRNSFFKEFSGYGYFQIFCKILNFKIEENLSNRCYTGFSQNQNNFSFVHGNSYVQANSLNVNDNNEFFGLVKMSLFQNQYYFIQNDFEKYDFVELFYFNPTNRKVSLNINDEVKVDILKHSVYKYAFSNKKIIRFKSNCCFLRPIVFCYKKQFLDVHHA